MLLRARKERKQRVIFGRERKDLPWFLCFPPAFKTMGSYHLPQIAGWEDRGGQRRVERVGVGGPCPVMGAPVGCGGEAERRKSNEIPGFLTLGKEKMMVGDQGPDNDGWANTSES